MFSFLYKQIEIVFWSINIFLPRAELKNYFILVICLSISLCNCNPLMQFKSDRLWYILFTILKYWLECVFLFEAIYLYTHTLYTCFLSFLSFVHKIFVTKVLFQFFVFLYGLLYVCLFSRFNIYECNYFFYQSSSIFIYEFSYNL